MGYSKDIDGFTVTNTSTAKRDIEVNKVWVGGADRPDVTIHLFAGQTEVDSVKLVSPNLTHTFTQLPVYDVNGDPIAYTITEDDVVGYSKDIDGFTVTNTKKVGSLEIIKVNKDNQGLQGAKFELRDELGTTVISTGTTGLDGKFIFENIPFGTYQLVEIKAPDGYKLDKQIRIITINDTGIKVIDPIINEAKAKLPDTGGPGTIIFAILGLGLMAISYIGYRRRYS